MISFQATKKMTTLSVIAAVSCTMLLLLLCNQQQQGVEASSSSNSSRNTSSNSCSRSFGGDDGRESSSDPHPHTDDRPECNGTMKAKNGTLIKCACEPEYDTSYPPCPHVRAYLPRRPGDIVIVNASGHPVRPPKGSCLPYNLTLDFFSASTDCTNATAAAPRPLRLRLPTVDPRACFRFMDRTNSTFFFKFNCTSHISNIELWHANCSSRATRSFSTMAGACIRMGPSASGKLRPSSGTCGRSLTGPSGPGNTAPLPAASAGNNNNVLVLFSMMAIVVMTFVASSSLSF